MGYRKSTLWNVFPCLGNQIKTSVLSSFQTTHMWTLFSLEQKLWFSTVATGLDSPPKPQIYPKMWPHATFKYLGWWAWYQSHPSLKALAIRKPTALYPNTKQFCFDREDWQNLRAFPYLGQTPLGVLEYTVPVVSLQGLAKYGEKDYFLLKVNEPNVCKMAWEECWKIFKQIFPKPFPQNPTLSNSFLISF